MEFLAKDDEFIKENSQYQKLFDDIDDVDNKLFVIRLAHCEKQQVTH